MSDTLFLENKKLNESEIEQRRAILASRVTSLVVTLTTKCNISCIMCEEKFIPWEIPGNILQGIIGLFPYLEEIIWQGGEVLILDYFEDLLKEANKFPHLHQSIITNGLPVTEKLAEKLVKENVELTFSIDATTKELYESIRRKAKFEELISSIELVNRLRKTNNLKNMSFRMHAVVMNSNYLELVNFIDFAKRYGFDALHLMPIWGNLDSQENIFYRKNDKALNYIKENIRIVQKKAKEYGVNLLNSIPFTGSPKDEPQKGDSAVGPDTNNGALMCHMPWKRMVINPAGNVCPACHCKEMVGNVLDNTLAEIWNNAKMQNYRERLARADYLKLCSQYCIQGVISEELRGLK